MTPEALVRLALEARERAWAPYSEYLVGAAVLTAGGRVFQGCNVENASYGLTVCAERVAIFNAVVAGATDIREIAVATKDGASMCGACRQVAVEFGTDIRVHLASLDETYRSTTVGELLPGSFSAESLPDASPNED